MLDTDHNQVVATIPVGLRPRGVRISPDGRWLYVALTGSPKGGPTVDEAHLPPPDRAADGIGVVNLTTKLDSAPPLRASASRDRRGA